MDKVFSEVLLFLPRLGLGFLILVAAGVAAFLLQKAVNRLGVKRGLNSDLTGFLGKAAFYGLLTIGVVAALGILGVDVLALVVGIGLVGFALALALKDIIANAVSGMIVLLYRPFVPGDQITVASLAGTVTEINLRYTVLSAEGRQILIPNSTLFAGAVTVERKGMG